MKKEITNREALQALLDGKKIANPIWDPHEFIRLDGDDILVSENGCPTDALTLDEDESWKLWEEPIKYPPPPGWIDFEAEEPEVGRPIFIMYKANIEKKDSVFHLNMQLCFSIFMNNYRHVVKIIAWKYI